MDSGLLLYQAAAQLYQHQLQQENSLKITANNFQDNAERPPNNGAHQFQQGQLMSGPAGLHERENSASLSNLNNFVQGPPQNTLQQYQYACDCPMEVNNVQNHNLLCCLRQHTLNKKLKHYQQPQMRLKQQHLSQGNMGCNGSMGVVNYPKPNEFNQQQHSQAQNPSQEPQHSNCNYPNNTPCWGNCMEAPLGHSNVCPYQGALSNGPPIMSSFNRGFPSPPMIQQTVSGGGNCTNEEARMPTMERLTRQSISSSAPMVRPQQYAVGGARAAMGLAQAEMPPNVNKTMHSIVRENSLRHFRRQERSPTPNTTMQNTSMYMPLTQQPISMHQQQQLQVTSTTYQQEQQMLEMPQHTPNNEADGTAWALYNSVDLSCLGDFTEYDHISTADLIKSLDNNDILQIG